MSQKHPVIAVTGSSGAGTSTVKNSFEIGRARVGKECRSRWSPYH